MTRRRSLDDRQVALLAHVLREREDLLRQLYTVHLKKLEQRFGISRATLIRYAKLSGINLSPGYQGARGPRSSPCETTISGRSTGITDAELRRIAGAARTQ